MKLHMSQKSPTAGLMNAAIAALVRLDREKSQATEKRGLTGVRAVATGAAIYTAGLGAYKGQRFVRERLSSNRPDDHGEDVRADEEALAAQEPDDAEAENEVIDDMGSENEPEASEDEEEPEAYEAEEEPEPDEDVDEPEASGDQDEPVASEDVDEPEASEEQEEQPEAPEGGDHAGPSGEEQEQPETVEEADAVKAKGRAAATHGRTGSSGSDTPSPRQRKPARAAARKKSSQPSLKRPQQPSRPGSPPKR